MALDPSEDPGDGTGDQPWEALARQHCQHALNLRNRIGGTQSIDPVAAETLAAVWQSAVAFLVREPDIGDQVRESLADYFSSKVDEYVSLAGQLDNLESVITARRTPSESQETPHVGPDTSKTPPTQRESS